MPSESKADWKTIWFRINRDGFGNFHYYFPADSLIETFGFAIPLGMDIDGGWEDPDTC